MNLYNITLVDYGAGNLHSVEKALVAVGAKVHRTTQPSELLSAKKVVLPGVGAFGEGMEGLRRAGLQEALIELVRRKTPLFGICLGMQLLFEVSEEMGNHPGLGFLSGRVQRFASTTAGFKIPHTGWNQVCIKKNSPLLRGLGSNDYAYFNHDSTEKTTGQN